MLQADNQQGGASNRRAKKPLQTTYQRIVKQSESIPKGLPLCLCGRERRRSASPISRQCNPLLGNVIQETRSGLGRQHGTYRLVIRVDCLLAREVDSFSQSRHVESDTRIRIQEHRRRDFRILESGRSMARSHRRLCRVV